MTEFTGKTYESAGVDIDASDQLLRMIAPAIARTHSDRVLRGVGHFGGFYRIGAGDDGLTLVASIDGIGTKLKVASIAGHHRGIGHDIVNHCINDILACGARPICFLDYFATGKLDPATAALVIGGIAEACNHTGIALLGGETAEMPGIYQEGDYDVAGVILGLVDQDDIVDGSKIQSGNAIVGFPSDGFHTNGYSLIRSALGLNEDEAVARDRLLGPVPWDPAESLADALLKPHRCYLEDIVDVNEAGSIYGMAHITGGGIAGNLGRIMPDSLTAVINVDNWEPPRLMMYVAERGHIDIRECFRVFNMGIGFIVVCPQEHLDAILRVVDGAVVLGEVMTSKADDRVVLDMADHSD